MRNALNGVRQVLVMVWSCLFALSVQAAANEVTKEATGFGKTYKEAAASALLEAVRQVRGSELSSSSTTVLEFERIVGDGGYAGTTGVIEPRDNVSAQSLGWVSSYDVLSVKEPSKAGGEWQVKVRAQIPVAKSMEAPDDRPTLVVVPIRFSRPTAGVDDSGRVTLPNEVAARLQEGIQTRLVQSTRFSVLNRDFGASVIGENLALATPLVPPAEAAKFGQLAGADLVLTGTVFELASTGASYYGSEPNVRFEFAWQLIEAATQRILWSERLTKETSPKYDQRASQLIDAMAADVVSSLLDARFPVRVLSVNGASDILVNQGQSRLAVGQQFEVLAAGKALKDPQTGKMLDVAGPRIASVEVSAVAAEYSTVKLLDGQVADVKVGQSLKRIVTKAASKEVRPTAGSSEEPIKW